MTRFSGMKMAKKNITAVSWLQQGEYVEFCHTQNNSIDGGLRLGLDFSHVSDVILVGISCADAKVAFVAPF